MSCFAETQNIKIADYNSVRWSSLYCSLNDLFIKKNIIFQHYNEQAAIYNSLSLTYSQEYSRYGRGVQPIKSDFLMIMERIKDVFWDYLESLLKYLKVLYEYTKDLQYENQTLSLAFLGFKALLYDSIIFVPGEFKIIEIFVISLRSHLLVNFSEIFSNEYVLLSCIVDPRTKDFVEKKYLGFTDAEYELSKKSLKKKMGEIRGMNLQTRSNINMMNGKYDKFRNDIVLNVDISEEDQIELEFNKWILFNRYISTEYKLH